MSLKLMYITNDVDIAKLAENCGVDWIFIDLEILGKEERQGHLDTVISFHSIDDVRKLRKVIKKSKLLVRVNPINQDSSKEIENVIKNGADIIMLPYFKNAKEVSEFLRFVDGRVETCLLCETKEAVEDIDNILSLDGIDYIHIGLNDMHLSYGLKFMFQLLINGTVEMLCEKFKKTGIPYGFGGIAQLGHGAVAAEYIIAEHFRLGSTMAILSRSFCDVHKINDISEAENIFKTGIDGIRKNFEDLKTKPKTFFKENILTLNNLIEEIENN